MSLCCQATLLVLKMSLDWWIDLAWKTHEWIIYAYWEHHTVELSSVQRLVTGCVPWEDLEALHMELLLQRHWLLRHESLRPILAQWGPHLLDLSCHPGSNVSGSWAAVGTPRCGKGLVLPSGRLCLGLCPEWQMCPMVRCEFHFLVEPLVAFPH